MAVKFQRQIASGTLANALAIAIQFATGLVLIPLLYRFLSSEEVGIWFIAAQSTLLLSLLDFGLGPIFARKLAIQVGLDSNDQTAQAATREFDRVVGTGRRLYAFNTMLTGLATLAVGLPFLAALPLQHLSVGQVWQVWIIACVNFSLGTLATYKRCLLVGCSQVSASMHATSVTRVIGMIAKVVVIMMGGASVVDLHH